MRIVAFIVGLVTFGLVVFFVFGDALVDESWLAAFGPWVWLVAVAVIVADIVLPIPSTLVITFMAQRYGIFLGGLIGTIGTFTAGVVAYGFTRMLGPRFAQWLLRDELESARTFFEEKGGFAVVCSRWLPLMPEAVSCLAGLARMPFRRYCVALMCGSIPMCYAYAGLAKTSDNEVVPLVISIVLPIPIWWVASFLLKRSRKDHIETTRETV